MRNSLTWRLTALLHIVVITLLVVFAASALVLTKRSLVHEERVLLEETARGYAANIDQEYLEEKDLAQAVNGALEAPPVAGVRVEVLDRQGRRLGGTAPGEPGAVVSLTEGPHRAIAAAACGVVIVASITGSTQAATLSALARALFLAAIPLLAVAFIVGRHLIRRVVRPLAEVGRRACEATVDRGVHTMGPRFGLTEIDALIDSFDQLLERLDDLLQSERRFTHSASHELKTPLTVLSGELEMLLDRPDLPPDAHDRVRRAAAQVQTLRELVEALLLLRMAAPVGGEAREGFEPVNLADIARDVVAAMVERHPARRADVELTAPDEVLVSGQPVLLASAVRNLVDNACKFTSRGQPVRVEVKTTSVAEVIVDDGGPGVPVPERERIFDPFYRGRTVRPEAGGFGLGLPILRHVARAHGGEVLLQDSPVGGARFVLRLPLWSAGKRAECRPSPGRPARP
jgi:signal transduction histidine kinase